MELERIKTFFQAKHIHASHLWIEACLDWYKSENPGNSNIDKILKDIYEQWLVCDLRDIELGCLPEDLKSHKKITLTGKYALQMHYLIDVSQPAYSQLQQIRNVNTTNERVTAETQNESYYAPVKANRVLNLYLCDGLQEVKGMEYKTIRKLNTKLTPGVKVLIEGPVECRNGVLFLEDKNIHILGGEIEDLLVENAYENVLAKILKLELNPNPNQTTNAQAQHEDSDIDDLVFSSINIDANAITSTAIPSAVTENRPSCSNIPYHNNTTKQISNHNSSSARGSTIHHSSTSYENNSTRLISNNLRENTSTFPQSTENRPSCSNLSYHNNTTKPISHNSPTTADDTFSWNQPVLNNDLLFDQYEEELRDTNFELPDEVVLISASPEIVPKRVPSQPYVYIKQLLEKQANLPRTKYTIKGRIKRTTDKLVLRKGEWTVSCEIEDGTGILNAKVSNSVLEELIGYSAEQVQLMRRHFADNNFQKEQLLQALELARIKMLTMNCLMMIEFGDAEPRLISFREMSYTEFSLLEGRAQSIT